MTPFRHARSRLLGLSVLLLASVATGQALAADDPEAFLGTWSMTTRMGDSEMTAQMTLSRGETGAIEGQWVSRGMDMTLVNIVVDGNRIEFDREIPGGNTVHFAGSLDEGTLAGNWRGAFGEAPSTGVRGEAEPHTGSDAIPDRHDRPIVEQDGRRFLWAGEDDGGNVEWFDMTASEIDPHRFQFGIGKDTISSIDDPEFVTIDDPRLAARGVTRETEVLGVEIDGIARAYPVDVMSMHEVVNDEFGGKAYAVLW